MPLAQRGPSPRPEEGEEGKDKGGEVVVEQGVVVVAMEEVLVVVVEAILRGIGRGRIKLGISRGDAVMIRKWLEGAFLLSHSPFVECGRYCWRSIPDLEIVASGPRITGDSLLLFVLLFHPAC